jgi:hypothetical protein
MRVVGRGTLVRPLDTGGRADAEVLYDFDADTGAGHVTGLPLGFAASGGFELRDELGRRWRVELAEDILAGDGTLSNKPVRVSVCKP